MPGILIDSRGNSNGMLNLNVGVLGHVDSGKTSLAKALSEVASTAAFDKNPQSRERGITLDLGFSSFYIATPEHLRNELPDDQIQLTLVDCPGHASLIRTIIGGAQIIDFILLVVDVTKGIQTQTAECLVIGEITCRNMIVVLNKMDLLEQQKEYHLVKMKKRLKHVLSTFHFGEVPIIAISADPKDGKDPLGIEELVNQISKCAFIPTRRQDAPFLFAVDHCFAIKGKGTVMTGTVLQGSVSVDDVVDIPAINSTKKIKSMQMFRKPVPGASAGDRLGICVTQFDPKLMERGIVCAPGFASFAYCAVVAVTKIKYFKPRVATKSKFHITIGHETAMATITCFTNDKEPNGRMDQLDLNDEYQFLDSLNEDPNVKRQEYLLLEFEKPVLAIENCLIIGSKLDMDVHGNDCRLAFYGNLLRFSKEKDYRNSFLPSVKVYKVKSKSGIVDRIVNDNTVIVKNMFKKETNLELFMGLNVEFSTGESGVIENSFGQGGKVKVYCKEGLKQDTLDSLKKNKNQHGTAAKSISIILTFKKYVYDLNKKIMQ